MWQVFAKPKKTFVTILFFDNVLSMSMFESERITHQKACETVILERGQWYQGVIFNMTAVKKFIASFFARHARNACYVALGIEGAALCEDLIMLERDALASFDGARRVPHNVVWNTMLLSSPDTNVPLYLFGMKREHIMQYQLLALQTPFSCCVLSSFNAAVSTLYTAKQQGSCQTLSSFKSQRAHALEQFLSNQTTFHVLDEKKEMNAGHVGLFLLGKNKYENA